MNRVTRAGYATALAVILVDQLTKWIAAGPLDLTGRLIIPVLPIFDLRYVQNFGVSMGFLVADSDTGRWLLVAMTGLIALVPAIWILREKSRADAVALGLVLGGALGNILDRVRLGHVFDFLDLHFGDWHPFLVFNVADAAITLGVVALLLRAFLVRGEPAVSEDKHA
ncbi:signal peptidase II [Sphingomonas quercus]|uniref:Lipoprotein signal peptidase n=1 Tax=Sphingomonas quercus TaxID=2842451 RepID=A0ABS6BG72_9SPHN|nr:signal peptidase II [Sphingomonas quercus]MBU3077288.1 signal peptidase II [Sphingomonas quercus]